FLRHDKRNQPMLAVSPLHHDVAVANRWFAAQGRLDVGKRHAPSIKDALPAGVPVGHQPSVPGPVNALAGPEQAFFGSVWKHPTSVVPGNTPNAGADPELSRNPDRQRLTLFISD